MTTPAITYGTGVQPIVHLTSAWAAAMADAGHDAVRDRAQLFVVGPGVFDEHERARFLEPQSRIRPDELSVDSQFLDALNERVVVNGKIALPTRIVLERPSERRCAGWYAGILRHELEHAVQRFALDTPQITWFSDYLCDVIVEADHANSGLLYNQMPTEADANAAAAVLVRGAYASDIPEIELLDPQIARETEPSADPTSLPARMAAFAQRFDRDILDSVARTWTAQDYDNFLAAKVSDLGLG